MLTPSLLELDRAHLIHPVAPWTDRGASVKVLRSGKGVYLTDRDGHVLLDGFSGLWCVNAGYGHESVVTAAIGQLRALPYATGYFGFASEPAITLAAELCRLAPPDLNHVFFTLGGSDAVDSAVKVVRAYFHLLGKPEKNAFIAIDRGYHGSTTTASGLTGLPLFHQLFGLPMPWQHHISSPYPYRNPLGASGPAIIANSVAELTAKVQQLGPENVAALICEPVQGSGGVIVPPLGWLKAMRAACSELGILFIADEVITGFGRTGPLFACEAEGVEPDLMTLAKGLTSGYAPMGALLVSERIHQTIAHALPEGEPLGHGFTYSGHPLSAAIALEVLRLYSDGGILAIGQAVAPYFEDRLKLLAAHPLVGDIRSRGLLAGIELVINKADKSKPPKALRLSERLSVAGYQRGLIFRAFSDGVIGLAPPLCITRSEIDTLIDRLALTLDDILALPEVRHALN